MSTALNDVSIGYEPPPDGDHDPALTCLEQRLRQIRPGSHLCLIYDSRDERFRPLAAFIHDGLARGEPCTHQVGTKLYYKPPDYALGPADAEEQIDWMLDVL